MKAPEFNVTFRAIIERISTDSAGGYKITLHAFEETEAIKSLLDYKDANCEIAIVRLPE